MGAMRCVRERKDERRRAPAHRPCLHARHSRLPSSSPGIRIKGAGPGVERFGNTDGGPPAVRAEAVASRLANQPGCIYQTGKNGPGIKVRTGTGVELGNFQGEPFGSGGRLVYLRKVAANVPVNKTRKSALSRLLCDHSAAELRVRVLVAGFGMLGTFQYSLISNRWHAGNETTHRMGRIEP